MSSDTLRICVVGLGPRGLSVLERLCANAAECLPGARRVHVHLVDPHLSSGGWVWRVDQHPELLMNTVASQVTMFLDDSVECDGPVVPGPSLYDWARFVTLFGQFDELPEHVRTAAAELGPDTYPSRAFYGHYLAWTLRHLVRNAPDTVSIEQHPVSAVDLVDAQDGTQVVTLSDGTTITGLDSVVLTMGHLPAGPTEAEAELAEYAAANGLTYLAPANPADVTSNALPPGGSVILRGMGLNFFDHMALLTIGRGGGFYRDPGGRLAYRRSGLEPKLIAGSRRGVPYHSRGENQKGASGRHIPLFLTPSVIAGLRARADRGEPVDFVEDLWPLIDREVQAVYYSTLIRQQRCDCEASAFLRQYVASDGEATLAGRFGVAGDQLWDWSAISRPHGDRMFAGPGQFTGWLLSYLDTDIAEARRGNVLGPLKSALDVLRDLRNEIRLVVDHGGLSGDSYREDLQGWYMPLNAFVSIGPPTRRIEEMIALISCGVLEIVGPDMTVECPGDGLGFLVRSPAVAGSTRRAAALIEARLPEADIRATTDPLISGLLARGECRPYRIPVRGGSYYQTGGLDVTQRPYRILDAAGQAHPRRFAFGVPTETVHWVTAAGIRPGVNSVTLADADAVARASLVLTPAASELAVTG